MADLLYNAFVAVLAYGLFRRRVHGLRLVWRFAVLVVVASAVAAPFAYVAIDHGLTDAMFSFMRSTAFVAFLHVPVIATVSAMRIYRDDRRTAVVLGAATIAIVAFTIQAFVIEPTALEVREVRIASHKVSRPLTIALIADLQTDGPTAYERRALEIVRDRKPDLILFSGDYVHAVGRKAYARSMRRLNGMLKELALTAPLGVYAVKGDVEPIGEWHVIFEDTGIRVVDETTRFETDVLTLTALSRRASFDTKLEVPRTERFQVVVGHGPDFALGEVDADLLLAGHTHGGQVQLPFVGPIITLSSVPRDWASGVTALSGDRTLIVSRGVGMERGYAPQMRFLCRPELVFVEVRPR